MGKTEQPVCASAWRLPSLTCQRLSVKLSGACAPRRPYLTKKALSFIPQIVGNLDQVWT